MQAHFWNAFQESLGGGRKRTQLHGKHVAYRKLGATGWSTIDPTIQRDFSCSSFAANVQFPTSSQGTSTLLFDAAFSMKRHIEEKNGNNAEPGFEVELVVGTQHNVDGHIDEVNPSLIRYTNAWDTADLCLGLEFGRSTRIQHLVEIKSMPSGDGPTVEYDFFLTSSTAKIFGGPKLDKRPWDGKPGGRTELNGTAAFVARGDSQLRGMMLKPPVAWYFKDGEKISTPVRVSFTITKLQEVKATKHIPRTLIGEALAAGSSLFTDATFYPDASPETSSVDGYTGNSNVYGSWSGLMAASATLVLDDVTTLVQTIRDGGADVYRDFNRPITLFDTSSIGADQTVTAATQELTVSSANAGTSWDGINLNVYGISPASNTAIVTADHLTISRTPALSAGDAWGALRTTGSGAVASFVFNASGLAAIDTTGISKFAIAWEYEESDTTPAIDMSSTTGPIWHSAEAAGTANDPKLIVTHSAAAADSFPAALMML